jgi:hypothetical protein
LRPLALRSSALLWRSCIEHVRAPLNESRVAR